MFFFFNSFADIPQNAKSNFSRHAQAGVRASAPPGAHYKNSHSTSNEGTHSASATPSKHIPHLLATSSASAATNISMIIAGTASSSTSSSPTPSTSSIPTTMAAATPNGSSGANNNTSSNNSVKTTMQAIVQGCRTLRDKILMRLKFPTELHVVYVGVMLSLLLAVFSVFLLYRIMDIEAKTGFYHRPSLMDFHWVHLEVFPLMLVNVIYVCVFIIALWQ